MARETSKFWVYLSGLNNSALEASGLENFKRTVNNGYFNWFVTDPTSPVFGHALKQWSKQPNPKALMTSIDDMAGIVAAGQPVIPTFRRRHVYRLFVSMLWDVMLRHDKRKLREQVSESAVGNPVRIRRNGRLITQDLAHSILECNAVMDALGPATEPKILEIGGGYGRTAHVIHTVMGGQYVIADIEPTLQVSEYYLSKAFGTENVKRVRVAEDFDDTPIVLLNAELVDALPSGYFDVTLSISTLPELSSEQVDHYLFQMQRLASRAVYLKQWMHWHNPVDGIDLSIDDYKLSPEWRLSIDRQDPLIVNFFNRIWRRS